MSWVAHDVEPYVVQRHFGKSIAFIPLLIGSYAPDMMSKWFVYGVSVFGVELKADDPATFHRGWPGVGFTHSLMYGVAVGALIFLVMSLRPSWKPYAFIWAYSFTLGQWLHAFTDMGDTVGTMLFFPFTTEQFSVGAWAYAGQIGRFNDAGAYFSGPGFVWDGLWILLAAWGWKVFTRSYFEENVAPADPFWTWAGAALPFVFVIALYRAAYFYGVCRWVTWLLWAHVLNDYSFSIVWGGPSWVPALSTSTAGGAVRMPLMAGGVCACCGGMPKF
jgi:hypothetical protein